MAKPIAIVIEDQANLVVLYEDALRLVGYDIVGIQDGLEALNYLAIHDAPDLVILDVNLPKMSGRDILKHIRSTEKYKATPVIVLTANSLMIEQIRPEITEHDYLHIKPIGMKELQDLAKSFRRTEDGVPAHMAETQKIPDYETISHEPTQPVILNPDNSTIEDEDSPIDPKAETQEHQAIITPDDTVISVDEDESGTL